MAEQTTAQPLWVKVIDQTRCIGCHACTTACKSENDVPLGVTRTYVKHVDVGVFPQARRAHQVTRCNQCQHAPCVAACPTSAMFQPARASATAVALPTPLPAPVMTAVFMASA